MSTARLYPRAARSKLGNRRASESTCIRHALVAFAYAKTHTEEVTVAAGTTVRVREETRRALAAIAKRRGTTIPEVVAQLVEGAEADEILAAHNRAISAPQVLEDYLAEVKSMEGTLSDGLRDDPWPTDSRGRPKR